MGVWITGKGMGRCGRCGRYGRNKYKLQVQVQGRPIDVKYRHQCQMSINLGQYRAKIQCEYFWVVERQQQLYIYWGYKVRNCYAFYTLVVTQLCCYAFYTRPLPVIQCRGQRQLFDRLLAKYSYRVRRLFSKHCVPKKTSTFLFFK